MRNLVIATAVGLSLIGLSEADPAKAAMRLSTHIPPEELSVALRTLEHDHDITIIFLAEDVRNIHTQGAVGDLTTDEALTKVLGGTGLSYRYLDKTTATIFPAGAAAAERSKLSGDAGSAAGSSSPKEGKSGSAAGFRLAQEAAAQAHPLESANAQGNSAAANQARINAEVDAAAAAPGSSDEINKAP